MNIRVAVISCEAYSDALKPFFSLFQKFWPDCPYPITLVTDRYSGGDLPMVTDVHAFNSPSWCKILEHYAKSAGEAVTCLYQEDMFFSGPVIPELIEHGVQEMVERDSACVRLYPCPGPDADYGDPYFGIVTRGQRYRISCQNALWKNEYLAEVASHFNTPQEFELGGTLLSNSMPGEVLAFKRDVTPYPVQYLVTAIVSGRWLPDAKKLCDEHGIEVDWTMRDFAS